MTFPPNNLDNYHESLIDLPEAEYNRLLAEGRLPYDLPAGLREFGEGLVIPEEPEISFDMDPGAVDTFLDTARWVRPGESGELLLADPAPLRALILRKLETVRHDLARIPIEDFQRRGRGQGFPGRAAAVQAMMYQAEELLRGCEYSSPSAEILRLAEASGCTAYDCEIVALAQDLGIPLVTVNRQVLAAFPGLAQTPEQFIGETP